MKADTLKGLAVISIADGAHLGRIDDVVIETKDLRIAALALLADRERWLIPFEQVQSVGSDAVTIPDHDQSQWLSVQGGMSGRVGLDELGKRRVVDEAGTFLGTISGVDVDTQEGRVIELEVAKGGVLGIGRSTLAIAAGEVISIGDEVMVVKGTEA